MKNLRSLSLLIKPASSLCNMRCRYCFYADEAEHRTQRSAGMMTGETARKLIDAAFAAVQPGGAVTFAFQGGEPTLAGLPFFERFISCANEANKKRLRLSWAIQTNGLLLDGEWADFLRGHHFLTGISLDGTKAAHDAFRLDAEGRGTYDRAAAAVKTLKNSGADVNLLCVVNGQTAAQPRRTYQTLKALGIRYLQFIPCLDPLDRPQIHADWSLTPQALGHFLCGAFDLWYQDWTRGAYISVRQFEDWVRLAAGLAPDMCASCGACGGYLAVEADGSLYPCDFYALDEWRLGSVEDDLFSLLSSPRMEAFRGRGAVKPAACRSCRFFYLCRGGCPRNWRVRDGRMANEFCGAFQTFFTYAEKRIHAMAEALSRQG